MSDRNFRKLIEAKWAQDKFVCVGLDTDAEKLPEPLRIRYTEYSPTTANSQTWLLREKIVASTYDAVCAYKLHPAYLSRAAMKESVRCIRGLDPSIPIILDGKYGDGSESVNERWASIAFDSIGVDAVTVNPYPGRETLQPFLRRRNKGIFVICNTSGPGSGEFQASIDMCGDMVPGDYMPQYKFVAHRVTRYWNENGNCGLVVSANHTDELREVRERVFDMPILSPAIGPQQKYVPLEEQVERLVSAGKYGKALPMIVSASRHILYASNGPDFANAARHKTLELNDLINRYR